MPKLAPTTVAGETGPNAGAPLMVVVTRIETRPSGAFEGMMAFICPALTNTGIASTDFVPSVTFTETPPSVVASGNVSAGLELGPRFTPKIENSDPWAIDPPGKPAGMKLAPLTMPRGAISCAKQTGEVARRNRAMIFGRNVLERKLSDSCRRII